MATATSKDGTAIAYDRRGEGPVVVLVDGALGFRQLGYMPRLADLLAPRLTVLTYDRRGRGESGDTKPYSVAREIEDIEALISDAGGSGSLYGISSGAALALEAALELGSKIEKLAMYEPPYVPERRDDREWVEYRERLAAFLSEGRNGDAVALFMGFVGAPQEMIDGMRESPVWPILEATAPTLEYDRAALGDDRTVPADRAAGLAMPTLVTNGSMTLPSIAASAEALAQAIPNARHVTLEGQTHDVDPQVLAPILIDFLVG